MCIYYTIYKTTNILNGFIYIGQHKTKNLNDKYLGSGLKLRNAINKYGRAAFQKEILYIFDNYEDMNSKEAEIVTEEFIQNNNTYNIVLGGSKGIGQNNKGRPAWNKGLTGVQHYSTEHRQKISEGNRKPKTAEHRKNISLGKKGKPKAKSTCPHCGKTGGHANMLRYHYDNCKMVTC